MTSNPEISAESIPLMRALARFAISISPNTSSELVREQAKLCILDTLGCIFTGLPAEETQAFHSAEKAINAGGNLSSASFARLLGFAGDVFELNDLVGGHASIGTVSAALVESRKHNVSGAELLDAVIAGIEITSRLFESEAWYQKPFTESGIVITSMLSSIGTAAAVARLRDYSEEKTVNAMAIAGAMAPWGPAEVIFGDGGTFKPAQFGAGPAEVAIKAAEYVESGLTGPHNLIESPIGLMTTIATKFDADRVKGDGTWHLLETQRKLHASCGFTHSAIDAIRKITQDCSVDFDAVERIDVFVPDYIIPAVSKPHPPISPNDARFHLQYCIALAALGSDVILPEHSLKFDKFVAQESVRNLMSKIHVHSLTENTAVQGQRYNVCEISMRDKQREIIATRCEAPRGSALSPLSRDDVIQKFRVLAKGLLSDETTEACIEHVMDLDNQSNSSVLHSAIQAAYESQF